MQTLLFSIPRAGSPAGAVSPMVPVDERVDAAAAPLRDAEKPGAGGLA